MLKSLPPRCKIVNTIADSRLPALRRLELWLGDYNYGFDGDINTSARFLSAINASRLEYLGLRNAQVSDVYLLVNPQRLKESLMGDVAIKLDLSSESAALHDAPLHRGWVCSGEWGAPPAPIAHGELAYQQLWYAGFADLLRALHQVAGDARWLNPPDDILRMCDKWRCQQDLAAAGVSIPALLGTIDGYEDLRQLSKDSDCDRIFVKARYGSSAAGVLACCRHRDGREVAYASTQRVDDARGYRLFNTLAPQRHTDSSAIAALINALALQGAHIERWTASTRDHSRCGAPTTQAKYC